MSSKKANEKMLAFSLKQSSYVNDDFYVPVPNEYKVADYSFLSDYANSVVIVHKDSASAMDPADAELALVIQAQPIPCGMMYHPEKLKIYTELFTTYYPVFSDEKLVRVLDVGEGCGILCQFFSGNDPVVWCKYHGLIFVKNNAYIFHLIHNQSAQGSGEFADHTVFCNLATDWLERIRLPEYSSDEMEESELQEENRSEASVDWKKHESQWSDGDALDLSGARHGLEMHFDEDHKANRENRETENSPVCEKEDRRQCKIAKEQKCQKGIAQNLSMETQIGKPEWKSEGKNDYLAWLSKRVSVELWFELQLAYETIERFSNKYHLLSEPLLETTDLAKIQTIQNAIKIKREFSTMGQDKRYACGLAMRHYEKYLAELRDMETSEVEPPKLESEKNGHTEETLTQRHKEAEERRQREAELARQQKEAEERRRREAELARQQQEAEERRRHEAELARQQEIEKNKSRYNDLVRERQEQERIIAENRGWFGIQAKRRKAAKLRIQEIDTQLAREFSAGSP